MKVQTNKRFGQRECPSCATGVPTNSNRCPICGYEFPRLTDKQRGMKIGGGSLMLVLFIYLAFRLGRWIW